MLLTTNFSCDHSIIDLAPISDNNVNNFYKSQSDFEIALTGLYRGFRTLYQPNYLDLFSETRSDNAINYFTTVSGGMYADFDNFGLNASNSSLNNFWDASYKGIQRANIILNRIDVADFDENIKKNIEGESKFIRALFYFNLVRLYGDVPLILEEIVDPTTAFSHTRTPSTEVYSQIVKDLSEAEALLPDLINDTDFGRPSKWAAKGILARVYLTNKSFSEAQTKLTEIISSNRFRLLDDYKQVFEYTDTGNDEIIFAARFMKNTNGAGYPYQNINHDFQCSASYDFMYTFSDDPRLHATIDTSDVGIFYSTKKISHELGTDNTTSINRIELRMADVYLMMAEVLNELNGTKEEVLSYLNIVRERAGLEKYLTTDFDTKDEILDAILNERRIEFSFEDLRWFDLLRTGKAIEVMNKKNTGGSNYDSASAHPYSPIDQSHLLYPIPQQQIDASGGGLTQN